MRGLKAEAFLSIYADNRHTGLLYFLFEIIRKKKYSF